MTRTDLARELAERNERCGMWKVSTSACDPKTTQARIRTNQSNP